MKRGSGAESGGEGAKRRKVEEGGWDIEAPAYSRAGEEEPVQETLRALLEKEIREQLRNNPVTEKYADIPGPVDIPLDMWEAKGIRMGNGDTQECAGCGDEFGEHESDVWENQGFSEPCCTVCKIERLAYGNLADHIFALKAQVKALEKMRDA